MPSTTTAPEATTTAPKAGIGRKASLAAFLAIFGLPALGLAAPAVAVPAAAAPARALSAAAGDAIEWVSSFDVASKRARKENKLILLDFYTDWCGWCKRLDKDVFADASFQKAASGVLGVKINAEKEPALAQRFKADSFPRLFFLTSDGVTVERIRGFLNLVDFTAKVQAVKRGDTEFARWRVAASDARNVGAVQQFAMFLTEGGQYDQAIPYWQQLHDSSLDTLFRSPKQPGAVAMHRQALLELGNGYAAVGLPVVAQQQYEEVLRTYPNSPEGVMAVTGLGQLRAKNPSMAMPVVLLEQLVRLEAGNQVAGQAQALLTQIKVGSAGVAR